jgi:hypothetical protein
MNKFFKVDLGGEGWGLLANEGTAEVPKFRVVLKGSERWMERMAGELNQRVDCRELIAAVAGQVVDGPEKMESGKLKAEMRLRD